MGLHFIHACFVQYEVDSFTYGIGRFIKRFQIDCYIQTSDMVPSSLSLPHSVVGYDQSW